MTREDYQRFATAASILLLGVVAIAVVLLW